MIVLNAFSKGLVGALGALLCFVLFVVHKYNVSLWKRFFSFLKTNGRTHFGLIDLFLLGIINSLVIWFVISCVMANTIDWRVMSAEDCAVVALFFPFVFCAIIIMLFRRYSTKSLVDWKRALKLFVLNLFDNISAKVSSVVKSWHFNNSKTNRKRHPDPNSPITKFNYLFSFQYVPSIIEGYNNGLNSIEIIFDKSKYPFMTEKISDKVEITCSSSTKFGIDTLLITLPSTEAITEVSAILIYHSASLRHALLYTLEYSIDEENSECFVICQVKGEKHINTGIYVKDGNDFFLQTSTNAFLYFAELEKKQSENTLPELDIFISKVKETFGDNIPKDTYGTLYTDKSVLKSISSSLDAGIEEMFNNIDMSLRLIVQNKNESIFCLAGATNLFVDPIFTAYALRLYHFNGEYAFKMILERVKYYAKMFSNYYYKRTEKLIDFAKTHGKMKIAPFINKQTGEHFKSCAFIDSNKNVTLCAFCSIDFSSDESQTPTYIVKNKDHLVVVRTPSETYKLLDNNRLKEERNWCLSVIIQNIFSNGDGFQYKTEEPIAPLYDINDLNPDGTMKKSSIENTFEHVISEATRRIETLLTSCCVLGLP